MDEWQAKQLKTISACLEPGMHVADIGASRGEILLEFCPTIEAGMIKKYYAFEPHPDLAYALKKAKEKWAYTRGPSWENLEILDVAVSNENSVIKFYTVEGQPELGNMFGHDTSGEKFDKLWGYRGNKCHEHDVKSIMLDDFFKDRKIDFIKMDVEGAEFKAFEGARQILKERDIIWQVEFHNDDDWDPSILLECGYRFYDLDFNEVGPEHRRYQMILSKKDMSGAKRSLDKKTGLLELFNVR